jgi:transcriptional regulator GlxA family with amidase domain
VWRFGGGGVLTTLVAGRFVIDQVEIRPILKALPPFLHLQLDQKRNHALHAVLQLISLETEQPGLASDEMISRLCEMLVIHAIRVYAADQSGNHMGWLAGISDEHLGKVIQLLHSHLDKKWTVDSMAASAGMSRSSFASRFRLIVGQSPLEYLTQWRIHQASVLLRKTDESVAKIARRVGYASESAFTKIFKKILLTTPIDFRAESKQHLPS